LKKNVHDHTPFDRSINISDPLLSDGASIAQATMPNYQLPYMLFNEALEALKEILGSNVTEKKVIYHLDELHKRGLIVYFSGNDKLKDFIFTVVAQFCNVLKMLFNHNTSHRFSFGKIRNELKDDPFLLTPAEHEYLREKLSEGLLSFIFLEHVWLSIGIELDTLMELLIQLSIAYPMSSQTHGLKDQFALFPFYIDKEQNFEFKNDLNVFSLCSKFVGSFPQSIFYHLVVTLYQDLFAQFESSPFRVYKNSVNAVINHTAITICISETYELDTTEILFQCPFKYVNKKEVSYMWKHMIKLWETIDKLRQSWWPDLFSDCFLICPHCQRNDRAIPWHQPISKAKKPTILDCVACANTDGETIPALMVHPPTNGTGIVYLIH
jgi:hypothetical protein